MTPRAKARTYRRILTSFWTDPDVRAQRLTAEELLLLLYTFTSPHANLSGLYWLPFTYAASETGLALDVVETGLAGSLTPYITYDRSTQEILVHRLALHNVGETLHRGDRRLTAIERALANAHSGDLVSKWLILYPEWPVDLEKVADHKASEGAYHAPSPPEAPKRDHDRGHADTRNPENPRTVTTLKGHAMGHGKPGPGTGPGPGAGAGAGTGAGVRTETAIKHPPPSSNSAAASSVDPARVDGQDLSREIAAYLPLARANIVAIHGDTEEPVEMFGHEVGLGFEIEAYRKLCRAGHDPPEVVAMAIAYIPEVTGLEPPVGLARWAADDGPAVYEQCVTRAYNALPPAPIDELVDAAPRGGMARQEFEKARQVAREQLEALKREASP